MKIDRITAITKWTVSVDRNDAGATSHITGIGAQIKTSLTMINRRPCYGFVRLSVLVLDKISFIKFILLITFQARVLFITISHSSISREV